MLCLQNAATKAYPESPVVVSVEAHADFFKSLARHERLREELAAKPLETLAAFGIHLDATQVPSSVRLPSDEALAVFIDAPRYWNGFF